MNEDPGQEGEGTGETPSDESQGNRLKIDYPTEWTYTLFGTSEELVIQALGEVLGDRRHNFSPSNTSKKGKYRSFRIVLLVWDESDRLDLGAQLGGHTNILFVL